MARLLGTRARFSKVLEILGAEGEGRACGPALAWYQGPQFEGATFGEAIASLSRGEGAGDDQEAWAFWMLAVHRDKWAATARQALLRCLRGRRRRRGRWAVRKLQRIAEARPAEWTDEERALLQQLREEFGG